jgi:hypothetical protein
VQKSSWTFGQFYKKNRHPFNGRYKNWTAWNIMRVVHIEQASMEHHLPSPNESGCAQERLSLCYDWSFQITCPEIQRTPRVPTHTHMHMCTYMNTPHTHTHEHTHTPLSLSLSLPLSLTLPLNSKQTVVTIWIADPHLRTSCFSPWSCMKFIQRDRGGKISILVWHNMDWCEKIKVHIKTCVFLNGYQDRAVWIHKHKSTVNGSKTNKCT